MKQLFKILFVFFVFSSCASTKFKQDLKSQISTDQIITKIDSIVTHNMNQYNIPGLSLGVVRNNSTYYTRGYGLVDVTTGREVNERTIFHTASISKLFTAMGIMNLVDQNLISLDDKLIDILPKLKYRDDRVKNITIKNLLNHTSGIPDITNYRWNKNNQSDSSLEEYILGYKISLKSEPNTQFNYSNLGYDILGYIIQEVTASTFEDYMKENVLSQAEMLSSDFRHFEIEDDLIAYPHSQRWPNKKVYKRKVFPYTREHAPSSTLSSSSSDLCSWMLSFLGLINNLERKDTYSMMITPSTPVYPYIGLGFQLNSINAYNSIEHYGGDRGFRSYLVMIPTEELGLVLLVNADYNEDIRQKILHPIAKILLEKSKD